MKQIYSPRTQIRWKHPWRKHTAETGSQTTPLARNKAHRLAPGFSTAMQRRQLLSHTSVNQQQRAKRSQHAGVFTAKWLAPWVEKLLCAADRTGTPNALRLAWRHGRDLGLVGFHRCPAGAGMFDTPPAWMQRASLHKLDTGMRTKGEGPPGIAANWR